MVIRVFLLWAKWLAHETDLSLPCSDEMKNAFSYTSTLLHDMALHQLQRYIKFQALA
jgi:hypothetical protein